MKTQKQVFSRAQLWLNTYYPTLGDGAWSLEFIEAVFHGKHFGHDNRPKVLMALADTEMRFAAAKAKGTQAMPRA